MTQNTQDPIVAGTARWSEEPPAPAPMGPPHVRATAQVPDLPYNGPRFETQEFCTVGAAEDHYEDRMLEHGRTLLNGEPLDGNFLRDLAGMLISNGLDDASVSHDDPFRRAQRPDEPRRGPQRAEAPCQRDR